jgi:CubicO group peptidase (beta-lactamase class C family)
MHGDGLNTDLARERLRPTRNLATRADLDKLCTKANVAAAHCNGSASLALGWQVLQLDGRMTVDHSGNDPGVRTLAFFDPQRKVGAVVFTNGENGDQVIRKVAAVLYPVPLFLQTL